jgi:hypothetical protein
MCRKLPVVCQQNIPPSLISSKINVTDPKGPKVPISKNWTIIFFIHPILMHFMENVHLYESPRSQYKNWAKKFHNLEDIYRYNLHISSNFDVWCLSSLNWVRWYFRADFFSYVFNLFLIHWNCCREKLFLMWSYHAAPVRALYGTFGNR